MLAASATGSVAGLLIGARLGALEAVAGLVLGVLAAAVCVFVLNAVLIALSRMLGRNPAEIENGIAATATWVTAALGVALALLVLLRPY